jgi:hypothetical protein
LQARQSAHRVLISRRAGTEFSVPLPETVAENDVVRFSGIAVVQRLTDELDKAGRGVRRVVLSPIEFDVEA